MNINERNKRIEEHNFKVLENLINTDHPRNKKGKIIEPFQSKTGMVFSRLTVKDYAGQSNTFSLVKYYWTQCECGSNEKLIADNKLTTGNTTSCGCYHSESKRVHGLRDDPWYHTAYNQQQRMTNPDYPSYEYYGGRGLVFGDGFGTIEERIAFYKENFGPEPKKGYQIDRIDGSRGYAKDNVRYVTITVNAQNKDICHHHCVNGTRSRTIIAWVNNKKRGYLCESWAADSHQFLNGIGGEIPDGKFLARFDQTKPFGPDNFYFSTKIQRRPKGLI